MYTFIANAPTVGKMLDSLKKLGIQYEQVSDIHWRITHVPVIFNEPHTDDEIFISKHCEDDKVYKIDTSKIRPQFNIELKFETEPRYKSLLWRYRYNFNI